MNVNEAAILEKLVNGKREPAAHTKHATKKIRSRTQMDDLTQEFRCVSLFLERITFVGATNNFDVSRNELPFLSFPLRRYQRALHNNRSSSTKSLDVCVIPQRILLRDDLKIAQR